MKYPILEKFIDEHRKGGIYRLDGHFSTFIISIPGLLHDSPFVERYLHQPFGSTALLTGERNGYLLFGKERYRDEARQAFLAYIRDPESFDNASTLEEIQTETDKEYECCSPDTLHDLSEDDVRAALRRAYLRCAGLQVVSMFCESPDEDLIRELFNDLDPEETKGVDFSDFMEVITLPDFKSFHSASHEAILEKLDGPYEDIQWVFSDYFLTPKLDEIPDLIDDKMREVGGIEALRKELETMEKEVEANRVRARTYRAALPETAKRLLDIAKLSVRLRDTRKDRLFKDIAILSNCVRELFVCHDYPEELVPYSYYYDYQSGEYAHDGFPDTLRRRKAGCFIRQNGGKPGIELIPFEEAEHRVFHELFDLAEANESIEGTVANPGLVTGSVRIILKPEDFNRFSDGDVLVTGMTRPEFVPLIKRSAAVVTNEGGITCHAAIVSRELKKPCVIGTKIATKVLKDGDIVEVDADRGMVRVLDRVGDDG